MHISADGKVKHVVLSTIFCLPGGGGITGLLHHAQCASWSDITI